jgi:DNA-binding MarR family transcriptional regulator
VLAYASVSDAASRRRLNDAVIALHRFASSRKLDDVHASRSGVPLNLAAVGVLGRVVEHGPVALWALAGLSGMQPSALSRQVRLLEEAGHIERRPDPSDGRVSVVRATRRGRSAYQRVRRANDELLAAQLAGWTDAEVDHLAELMERLVTDLRRS